MSRKLILAIILSIDIIAVIIALMLGEYPEQYFGERTFVTFISFLQLLAISALAYIIFKIRKDDAKSKNWKAQSLVWLIIAIAFMYLSIDEVYEVHENLDFFIHHVFRIQETGLTDRIDDIIIGSYGLFGLVILYFHREEFKKYRDAFPLLKVGFILMFTMIVLDALTNREDVLEMFISDSYIVWEFFSWLNAIEDVFKIIAEGVFIGAFYYCLEITRRLSPEPRGGLN